MLELYFIRHGQSTNNVLWDESIDTHLHHRAIDPELTPIGEEQARLVADFVARPKNGGGNDPQNRAGFGLTHLYCSLMMRAVKTGVVIAEKTGLPLVAWPEIHETGGLFEVEFVDDEPVFIGQPGPGRSYFNQNFPQLILPDDLPESGWYNREKEPRDNYSLRAQSIIDRLLEEHGDTDHRMGLVMHGGIFARILRVIFNVQTENYWFLMNNCAVSRLDISPTGLVHLMYMNKVDHFPDHLIT